MTKNKKMSAYGLIKETSRIMRSDTISDLGTVNNWLYLHGYKTVVPIRPSVRQLENAVALAIEDINPNELPSLLRGKEFYISILPEITEKERESFLKVNQIKR